MQTPPKEWIDFLREQYPVGSRIRLSEPAASNADGLKPGSMGTLTAIGDDGSFLVKWEDERESSLTIGEERFKVLPPETQTLKLFMPLTAELIDRDEYGDLDYDNGSAMNGHDLVSYEDVIAGALLRERMPEEEDRGLMHWYHEEDSVNDKVRSLVFNVEVRENQLWGVAECKVTGTLTPDEMQTLMSFAGGQASDGAGESFEQHEIKIGQGEMYVHLWNSDHWSIMTEQERFDPKFKNRLPDMCWSVLPGEGKLICIKRGESGYYLSDWGTGDPERNRRVADHNNQERGITWAQEQAMLIGSMAGWNSPGADPKTYEQKQQEIGGMTFG